MNEEIESETAPVLVTLDSDEEELPPACCDDLAEHLVTENCFDCVECNLNVVNNKHLELDDIQKDLDNLVVQLNGFIADSEKNRLFDEASVRDDESVENNESVLEKQDGPSEKELRLNLDLVEEKQLYVNDGINPPEINWEAVGPLLQKHVSDLQKIQNLNQMTEAIVQRIRNVPDIQENILKLITEDQNEL